MFRIISCIIVFGCLLCSTFSAATEEPASAQSTATPLAPVEVHANVEDHAADIGSLDGTPLKDNPVSVHVIDRRQLDAIQPRSLSEVMRADAATSDNYAPVGYYQNLAIRGFPLDLASGYRSNGLAMAGEQRITFEDRQSVQILKGLAGIEAGMLAPGGLVNLVSKRPAEVRTITLGTDTHGSRHLALDVGTWLTPQLGVRFNTAWEDTHSYIEHADGRRNLYAVAVDWMIGERATLQLDSDYQTSAQRSASGYQLLGGTALPAHPHGTWMLGHQPWQQPVGIRSANNAARFGWQFNDDWKLRLAASDSRSVIEDNVAFAYGCFYLSACASGDYPGNYFAPDGGYDIYDYRNPDDTRRNQEARAIVSGHFDTGVVQHALSVGLDATRRTVDQRPDVNDYVGSTNVNQREPPHFAPSPAQPGSPARRLDNRQQALLVQDRMQFGDRWQLLAGARRLHLDEHAYDDAGVPERQTRFQRTLPQAALLWLPTPSLTTYISYSEGLALGQEAPFWTSNDGQILAPLLARQVEAGIKLEMATGFDLSAAVFRIRRPSQFAKPDESSAGYTFVQQGEAVHDGIELAAHGRLAHNLRLDASAAWIRARAHDTGAVSYEGHQLVNVPALRLSVLGDYQVAALPAFGVLVGMRYVSPNPATPDHATRTPAWTVFDTGLRYRSHLLGRPLTWHLMASNVFNRFYWRDTGSAYGDHYLFPGAPRQIRLSANWVF